MAAFSPKEKQNQSLLLLMLNKKNKVKRRVEGPDQGGVSR